MRIGQDTIGVGVGAMVFNDQNQVFLAQRGPQARNEKGCWEFPGGGVEFGEKLADALRRELLEEYGLQIEVLALLCVTDHIISAENQHWVSPTFLARHVAGVALILEPEKCTAIGWFLWMPYPRRFRWSRSTTSINTAPDPPPPLDHRLFDICKPRNISHRRRGINALQDRLDYDRRR